MKSALQGFMEQAGYSFWSNRHTQSFSIGFRFSLYRRLHSHVVI
uniref:Uncharacterized protein n=1 Tax=Aegilops tauschii subsp. strangulata TaxID=200361 RepID=A0A453EVZ5_AEGTS